MAAGARRRPRHLYPLGQGSSRRASAVDTNCVMNGGPDLCQPRGPGLPTAHGASLDIDPASARERLDAAVGPELAQKLVYALCAGGPFRFGRRAA